MGMSEEEALVRSRKLLEQSEQSVELVATMIRRDKPDATSEELGGAFDGYGSATWAPSRASGIDWSAWGRWEAWEYCVFRNGRAEPTGDWIAWDAVSGQQIGFSPKSKHGARRQAEMAAVLWNEGRATRAVSIIGAAVSVLNYQEVRKEVERRIDADTRAVVRSEETVQNGAS